MSSPTVRVITLPRVMFEEQPTTVAACSACAWELSTSSADYAHVRAEEHASEAHPTR